MSNKRTKESVQGPTKSRDGSKLSTAGGGLGKELLSYISVAIGIAIVWELIVVVFSVPDYLLPSPWEVFGDIIDHWNEFVIHTWATAKVTLLGFVIALVLGVLVGAMIAFSKVIARIAYPLLVSAQAVPKVALAPIFVIWLGFGIKASLLMTTSIAIFPIIINTALGLSVIEAGFTRMGRASGGSKMRIFWKIQLPASMPSIFAGLKLGITLALIGAVVAEFVAANEGLGYLAQQSSGLLQASMAFGSLVMLAVLGTVLFVLVELVERVVVGTRGSAGGLSQI